ncbi:MAG: insulinase family protein [Myxococcales bacterium]|nr:insulinase family protein [Myxococcales bacterium]
MKPVRSFLVFSAALLIGCGGSNTVTPPPETSPPIVDAAAVCGVDDSNDLFEGRLNAGTESFVLDSGLRVILKQTPGNPVVAMRLFVPGGSMRLSEETAGIEDFALAVATRGGTQSWDKPAFSARLDSMGSGIGYSSALDYSVLSMNSLVVYLPDTWQLFHGVLSEPAFPLEEVERVREQKLQALLMREENPDEQVVYIARRLLFEGHPYSNSVEGVAETLSDFTADELREYFLSILHPNEMLLVVVGDVSRDDLTALIGETFEHMSPSDGEPPAVAPSFEARETSMLVDQADIPTNYIIGLAAGPSPVADDYAATVLALRHLSDRLFEEIRTERNLSYAVSSAIGRRMGNYLNFYITTEHPDQAIPVIYDEMRSLQDNLLTEQELTNLIRVFITRYYSDLDSNGAVAGELGWWELYGGGRENADRYIHDLEAVTPQDIQRAAERYLGGFQVGVVGRPSEVSVELFQGP